MDAHTLTRLMHRWWVATVRYWLPTKSVRDSRAYALGPDRNEFGLPVAGEAVNKPGRDLSKSFHTPSKR
jgi:hypothetical protein